MFIYQGFEAEGGQTVNDVGAAGWHSEEENNET